MKLRDFFILRITFHENDKMEKIIIPQSPMKGSNPPNKFTDTITLKYTPLISGEKKTTS